MTNETHAALYYAGPSHWHHLIAPTRTYPLTDSTTQAATLAMDSATGTFKGIEAACTLTDLASTAIILSNAIANKAPTATAQDIFKRARAIASATDTHTEGTPRFQPTFKTYSAFHKAASTDDPQVLTQLLIDVIRIANHITD